MHNSRDKTAARHDHLEGESLLRRKEWAKRTQTV